MSEIDLLAAVARSASQAVEASRARQRHAAPTGATRAGTTSGAKICRSETRARRLAQPVCDQGALPRSIEKRTPMAKIFTLKFDEPT